MKVSLDFLIISRWTADSFSNQSFKSVPDFYLFIWNYHQVHRFVVPKFYPSSFWKCRHLSISNLGTFNWHTCIVCLFWARCCAQSWEWQWTRHSLYPWGNFVQWNESSEWTEGSSSPGKSCYGSAWSSTLKGHLSLSFILKGGRTHPWIS